MTPNIFNLLQPHFISKDIIHSYSPPQKKKTKKKKTHASN